MLLIGETVGSKKCTGTLHTFCSSFCKPKTAIKVIYLKNNKNNKRFTYI